jgi:hypothetical protein
MFNRDFVSSRRYKHHCRPSDLLCAAIKGCPICTFLTRQLAAQLGSGKLESVNESEEHSEDREITFSYDLHTTLWFSFHHFQRWFEENDGNGPSLGGMYINLLSDKGKVIFVPATRQISRRSVLTKFLATDIKQELLTPVSSGVENDNPALRWLNTCRERHSECNESGQAGESVMPRRLLQLMGGSGKLKVKLLDTHSLPQPTSYFTLSHRWAPDLGLILTKSNLCTLEEDVSVGELPLTFQQAIIITIECGFSYLWIDGLCIIQNDTEDMIRELSNMGDIYGNATCNLAALIPEGRPGWDIERTCLFYTKPFALSLQTTIHVTEAASESQADGEVIGREHCSSEKGEETLGPGHIFFVHSALWENCVSQAPLNLRAWVAQERILSVRTLFFGLPEMFWECREKIASETFPSGLPTAGENAKEGTFISQTDSIYLEELNDGQLGIASGSPLSTASRLPYPLEVWLQIVEIYSRGNVTLPKDKLIAISGLAKTLHRSIGGRYYAGVWERNLISQLTWYIGDDKTRPRNDVYRAPTWSWASVDGDIFFVQPSESATGQIIYAEVVHAGVEVEGENEYGYVKAGHLHLRGRLRLGRLMGWDEGKKTQSLPEHERTFLMASASLNLDVQKHNFAWLGWCHEHVVARDSIINLESINDLATDNIVFIMPLWVPQRLSETERQLQQEFVIPSRFDHFPCLVLTPTGRRNGEFQRTGLLMIREGVENLTRLQSITIDERYYEANDGEGNFVISIV